MYASTSEPAVLRRRAQAGGVAEEALDETYTNIYTCYM